MVCAIWISTCVFCQDSKGWINQLSYSSISQQRGRKRNDTSLARMNPLSLPVNKRNTANGAFTCLSGWNRSFFVITSTFWFSIPLWISMIPIETPFLVLSVASHQSITDGWMMDARMAAWSSRYMISTRCVCEDWHSYGKTNQTPGCSWDFHASVRKKKALRVLTVTAAHRVSFCLVLKIAQAKKPTPQPHFPLNPSVSARLFSVSLRTSTEADSAILNQTPVKPATNPKGKSPGTPKGSAEPSVEAEEGVL